MRLALAGGGTGGHFIPGLAVTETAGEEEDTEALFFTSEREAVRPPEESPRFRRVGIPAGSFSRRRPLQALPTAAKILAGYGKSRRELSGFGAEAIVGLGGYVSVPPVLAARALGIPIVLHEQNMVPGRANLFLSRWAGRIALGFPLARDAFGARTTVLTGNPLLRSAREKAPAEELEERRGEEKRFTILIMGGSRGASFINALCQKAAGFWGSARDEIRFIHLTGSAEEERVRQAYATAGLKASVRPFCDRMGWLYSQSQLLVARAGAMTLSEAAYWGLPSLLIPYPWATDAHQQANAAYFEGEGAAVVLEQGRISPPDLVREVLRLKSAPGLLRRMSASARRLFRPGASEAILTLVREVIELKKGSLPFCMGK